MTRRGWRTNWLRSSRTVALSRALEAALSVAIGAVADEAADSLMMSIGAAFDPAEFALAMQEWAGPYVATVTRTFTDVTRRLVENVVGRYRATPGITIAQVEALLEGAFGARRAQVVAVTEITRAAAQATRQYQKILDEAGVKMRRVWRTSNDSLTCPICGPRNGMVMTDADPPPPAHPKCRCFETLEMMAE
jgi:SPP1 gp7 family putative phage head morphogenesis protein